MNMRISSAALALVAAAALTAGAVTPAVAASDPPRAEAQAKSEAALPAAKQDKRRYCIEDRVTGSRIPKRACRTRSEWIALTGADPVEAR